MDYVQVWIKVLSAKLCQSGHISVHTKCSWLGFTDIAASLCLASLPPITVIDAPTHMAHIFDVVQLVFLNHQS